MTPSERFRRNYKPIPDGTKMPVREFIEYRGLRLPDYVQARIDAYRALPSLTMQDIARMVK